MPALVQHDVALERLVGVLQIVLLGATQLVFQPACQLGQEDVVERPLVRQRGRAFDLVALVEAQAHGPRGAALHLARHLPDVAHALQHGRHLQRLLHLGGQGGQRLPGGLHLGFYGLQVTVVAQAAHGPAAQQQRRHQAHGRHARQPQAVATALPAHVGAGQTLLGEHHLAQQRGQEEAAATALLGRQHGPLQPEAPGQVAHDAVDGAALLGAAGEVHATHPGRLGKTRAAEHLVQQV